MSGATCGWIAVLIRAIRVPRGWAIPSAIGDRGTLVVDAAGFNDQTRLDDAGHPEIAQLHAVERYTRTSALVMTYEVTIEDPAHTHSLRPGERFQEYICLEGERDRRR